MMDDEVDRRTLFCGNLSPKITDEILFELFLQVGPVEKVSIPKDKEGKLRNFGFVTFKHEVSVGYAIQVMDGSTLFGRSLAMKNRKVTEQQRGQQQVTYSHHKGEPIQEYMARNLSNQQVNVMPQLIHVQSTAQHWLGQSLLALQGLQQGNFGNHQSNMLPQQRHNNERRQNYNDYQQQDHYQQTSRQHDRSNFHDQGGTHHDRDRSNNSRQHDRNVQYAKNDRSRHNDKPYNRRHRR